MQPNSYNQILNNSTTPAIQHLQQTTIIIDLYKEGGGSQEWLQVYVCLYFYTTTFTQVNKRLAGDGVEDPYFPKLQFPSEQDCSECKTPDGEWNIDIVSSFWILVSKRRSKR